MLSIKENLELKKAYYQSKVDASELRIATIRESITSSAKSFDDFDRRSPQQTTTRLQDMTKISDLVRVSHFTTEEETRRGASQATQG